MAVYAFSANGVALSTTIDTGTITTTATGAGSAVEMKELFFSGEAGSSSYARLVVNRPSAAPTGAITASTLNKLSPSAPNPTFQVGTAWAATNPTLSSTDVLTPGFNAFAGQAHWWALPGCEVVVGTQGAVAYLSIRSRSGTPTVTGHVLIEEL